MTYHYFWSGIFSQFFMTNGHICQFTLDGVAYNCAEQYMMHQKAVLFNDDITAAQIMKAIEPGKQKALGRKVAGYTDKIWNKHKFDIVVKGNMAKFGQNKGLCRKMFHTADAKFVEASPFDRIWGIGLDEAAARKTDPSAWPGQNLLGLALDQVKAELRQLHADE